MAVNAKDLLSLTSALAGYISGRQKDIREIVVFWK